MAYCMTIVACGFQDLLESPEDSYVFVPKTALAGVYLSDLEGFNASLQENESLKQHLLSFYAEQRSALLHPDSLSKWATNLQDLSLSWHSVSGNELAPLAIVRLDQSAGQEAMQQKLRTILAADRQPKSKFFDDYQVWLIKSEEVQWAYLLTDNLLVISTAEILIEDVVRSLNDEQYRLFGQQGSAGLVGNKVFINTPRYNELATKFFNRVSPFVFEEGLVVLDVAITPNALAYNGETLGLNVKENNNALLFGAAFIPQQAEQLKWQMIEKTSETSLGEFMASVSFDIFDQTETLFLLPIGDEQAIETKLNIMAEEAKLPGDSTIYMEEYASQTIGFIGNQFFQKLTNVDNEYLAQGAYYALTEEVLVFSPSAEMVRRSLAAHFDETTYGQSVEKRKFLASLIQDSYFTTIHNFEDNPVDINALQPTYAEFTESVLEQLNYATFQVNSTNVGYLIAGDVSFQRQNKASKGVMEREESLVANAFLDHKASTRPFIVRNHLTNENEIILQDTSHQLYQIGLQGTINWKVKLEDQLVSDIVQVDYYNNRKLQYLFTTDSLVHIIDRNGEEVEGFPKAHGISSSINGLQLVDYDNTKRYRYLISAGRGELHLFDKEVNPLENWNPKQIDAALSTTPFHDRVSGKDFFIVAERTNKIHLLNRKAEEYSGFPVDLEQRFSGDQFFRKLPSLSTSSIAVISDNGLLKKVNLMGKVMEQKQFLKKDNQDAYRLVNDVLDNGFLVLRTNRGVASVLTEEEEELCQIPLVNKNSSIFYYRLGGGKSVLMVWDEETANVSLYDLKGNELLSGVKASGRPSLLYFSREGNYQLFTNFESQVRIYESSAID